MKFRPYALVACAAIVVGLAACSDDPTSSGVGEPEAIVTTRSVSNTTVGSKVTITAFAADKNLQRIPGELSVATAGAAVAIDSVRYEPLLMETRIFLRATAKSEGTNVTVTGHGLSKDVKVVVT